MELPSEVCPQLDLVLVLVHHLQPASSAALLCCGVVLAQALNQT